ncbi:MAG: InlB B-repeat-containing protein, partial [Bacilli bacterium]|nr:InlB B-repeat-containing protein [Bacilli bacterium]
TAIWEVNNYEIVFDKNSNDATGTMSNQSMTYDESKTLTTNAFTRDGYTFVGWNTKADGTGTAYLDGASVSNVASSGTVTLYAQWAAISYTVTLDSNEGNIIDNVNLLSYETSMERNNDQYIVSGTTNTAGIYVPSEAFEGGKTYILRFKIQKVDGSLTVLGGHLVHTQIYFKIDGSNSSSRYTDYYSTTNNIPNDTNVHTVELKFTYNGSTSGVDRNVYIQPNRAKTDYFKVKIFDVELEELSTTKTVNFGGTYGTLPTPTTPGYQFAGWNGKNLLNYNDLLNDATVRGYSVDSNGNISFSGTNDYRAWNYDSSNWKFTLGSGDYKLLIYFSTQSSNDATGLQLIDESNNRIGLLSSSSLNGVSEVSLDFSIQSTTNLGILYKSIDAVYKIMIIDSNNSIIWEPYYVTSSTPLTRNEDHTLYAKWTPNTYSIVFDKNDNAATGTMGNQSMTYGTSSNLTNNSYYKRGYKFVGWNTASDGTGTAYLNGASVSNLTNVNNGTVTLYAQWEKLMAEDIGHTIQDLNCEDVQCVIDELYYMLY